jgi:hypothetical protein
MNYLPSLAESLLISASRVARIIGLSHQCPVSAGVLMGSHYDRHHNIVASIAVWLGAGGAHL